MTSRVIDERAAPTIIDIFNRVERGETFGDVARALNANGVVGRRGKPWVSRTVRTIVYNVAYAGEKGYPAIIDRERWHRIHDSLQRLDPAAAKRRQGGRRNADPAYFLRGFAFCGRCGAS